ncbi:hypothetical protein P7C70_g7996, partial [Phenoliferia sp. Uapishka_3]
MGGPPIPAPTSLRPSASRLRKTDTTSKPGTRLVYGQAVSTDKITTASLVAEQWRASQEREEELPRPLSPISTSSTNDFGTSLAPPSPIPVLEAPFPPEGSGARIRSRTTSLGALKDFPNLTQAALETLPPQPTVSTEPTLLSPIKESETAGTRLFRHRSRTNHTAPNLNLTSSRPITPGRKKSALLAAAARSKRSSPAGSPLSSSSPRATRSSPGKKRARHSRESSFGSPVRPREISVFEDDDDEDSEKKRSVLSQAVAYVLPTKGHKRGRSESSLGSKSTLGSLSGAKGKVSVRTVSEVREEEDLGEHGEYFAVGTKWPDPSKFIGLGVESQSALGGSGTDWEKDAEGESTGWALKGTYIEDL